MKEFLKKTMTKTQLEVLKRFLIGYPQNEIAIRMDKAERTIDDARKVLFRLFDASSINELCLKAASIGYANDILANLNKQRKHTSFEKLGMTEIIIVHSLLQGKKQKEIEVIIEDIPEGSLEEKDFDEYLESIKKKLKIKDISNIFYFVLVAGYIEPHKIELDDLDVSQVKESVGTWMKERKVLNIPTVRFENSYYLQAKSKERNSDINT